MEVAICADLEWCSLLLAGCGSRLGLGDTSAFLDSALDFLSLLATGLFFNDEAVLYNTVRLHNYHLCANKPSEYLAMSESQVSRCLLF